MNQRKKCSYLVLDWLDREMGIARKTQGQYAALQEIFHVEPFFLTLKSKNSFLRFLYRNIFRQIWVSWRVLSKPADIIYYRYYPNYLLLNWLFFLFRRGINLFVEVNSNYRDEYKTKRIISFLNKLSERTVYKSASTVLTITQELSDYVKSIEPQCHTKILGNGYDDTEDNFLIEESIISDDLEKYIALGAGKQKFIYVGKATVWHGIDKIIEIVSNLEESCLYLVCEPGQIKKLGLSLESNQGKVMLLGPRNLKELQYLYAHCDFAFGCFALERKNMKEAAPLKVRESLFHGLPVIIGYSDPQIQGVDFVHNYKDLASLNSFLARRFDRRAIRDYAQANLSWRGILRNIFPSETAAGQPGFYQGQAPTGAACT